MKIYVTSFNRASNGAISKLVQKMKDEGFWTNDYKEADYILAVGDRIETFDFVLERFRENKKIIHLWAGEQANWETHDDVYRTGMTLMSCMQLCTNDKAKARVKKICKSVNKQYVAVTVGNVMLDNFEIDESASPNRKYDLISYNPPSLLSRDEIFEELKQIEKTIKFIDYIWIEPNGDDHSDIILSYTNLKNLSRSKFLGLLKNCDRFITNSSCQYFEAPFLIKPGQIIPIGKRNSDRESKYADMTIPNASENIMKIFRSL